MNKITGITIVELLISLMISVFIVMGLTSMYWLTQKYFRLQAALVSLTENSHIAEQLWMTVLRSAVYNGCFKMKKISITPYYSDEIKPGTDAITIHYADTDGDDLLFDMKEYNAMYTTSSKKFSINDDIMITDCESVEFFKVKNVFISSKKQKIISDKPLKKLYKIYSQVNTYQHESYYIARTHRHDKYHQIIDALYRKNDYKTEMIEGISDMKIFYSVIEEGVMQDIASRDFNGNNNIAGIAIFLKYTSLIERNFHKMQNIYVSLR